MIETWIATVLGAMLVGAAAGALLLEWLNNRIIEGHAELGAPLTVRGKAYYVVPSHEYLAADRDEFGSVFPRPSADWGPVQGFVIAGGAGGAGGGPGEPGGRGGDGGSIVIGRPRRAP